MEQLFEKLIVQVVMKFSIFFTCKTALNFVDKWWSSVGVVCLWTKGHGVNTCKTIVA
jgi:hypothetical protein